MDSDDEWQPEHLRILLDQAELIEGHDMTTILALVQRHLFDPRCE